MVAPGVRQFPKWIFLGVGRRKIHELDFPEFNKNSEGWKRKLMEVAHVLVGIMPSGSIIYGISGHGCNWVGFSKF